jgi:PAS domain S-box-containing protein
VVASDRPPVPRHRFWGLVLGALGIGLTAAAVVVLLRVWAPWDRARTVAEWRGRLAGVADDRRRTIELWTGERRADLSVLLSFPSSRRLFVASPSPGPDGRSQPANGHLDEVLASIAGGYNYLGIWLLDANGTMLSKATGESLSPDARAIAVRAVDQRRTVVAFHRHGDAARLTAAEPFLHEGRARGVVVSESDPGRFLYPLLSAESLPTRTGETLLLEKDGETAVFDSPLRHDDAPPLTLRRPLKPGTAYTVALVGGDTFGSVVDYRGVRVLAATRPIQGTDWVLVVKIDEAEALVEHAGNVRTGIIGLLAALMGLTAIGLAVWRAQRAVWEVERARYSLQLARLIEQANDAILLVRRDGRIVHANPKAAQLYGYPLGELIGMFIHDLCEDGDRENSRITSENIERAGALIFEGMHRRCNGSLVAVEISSTGLDHQGERLFLSIVRDIDERKVADAQRAGELLVLEKIASGAPLSETLHTLVRVVEDASHGMLGSLLLIEDGVHVKHAAAPGLPEEYTRAIDGQAIGPGRGSCGTAAYLKQPVIVSDIAVDPLWDTEGHRELALRFGLRACWSLPILAADGTVLGTFALYHRAPRSPTEDELTRVTRATHLAAIAIHRKHSEDALRESETESRVTFENAGIGMALVDEQGHVVKVNATLEAFLGRPAAELSLRSFRDFIHAEDLDRDMELYRELLAGGRESYQVETRYHRPGGETVWGRLTASVVRKPDGRPRFTIIMVEDITERRRLQQEIQVVQKMEAIGLLAGGIAHDFNNILAVILGYGQIALRGMTAGDPARPRVEGILTAADRAAHLTQQLLAFSRKQTFDVRVLDLNSLIDDIAKILRRVLGEDVDLDFLPGPGLGRVRADRSQIDQIIMNLAVNARDAMPAGGHLVIETDNADLDDDFVRRHPGSHAGPHVRLAVRDTGCGMAPEVMARIFEPFFTTKGHGRGTGLGLATVYGIVKQSGGYILVDSTPGLGTGFLIYLPRVDEAPQREVLAEPVAQRGSETVLLAEDEPTLRELIGEQLESYGYRVLTAPNGAAALIIAERYPGEIDALVTDVVMPDLNGRELARRVALTRPRIRVLYMSGYTDDVIDRHGGLESGVFLISKPFMGSALARKLREVLETAPVKPTA